jgi:hypothetical protein
MLVVAGVRRLVHFVAGMRRGVGVLVGGASLVAVMIVTVVMLMRVVPMCGMRPVGVASVVRVVRMVVLHRGGRLSDLFISRTGTILHFTRHQTLTASEAA